MEIKIEEIKKWRYAGSSDEVEVLTKDGWRVYSSGLFVKSDVEYLEFHNIPKDSEQVPPNYAEAITRTAVCVPVTEFTKDCWECWAGCERWPNGDQPLICQIGCWTLRADSKGVETDCEELQDDMIYHLDKDFQTQAQARSFLNRLPGDFWPNKEEGWNKYQ